MDSVVEGWGEYRKLILKELERLSTGQNGIDKKIDELRASELAFRNSEIARLNTEIALLKQELRFKAGVWGFISGMIPALGALAWLLARGAG